MSQRDVHPMMECSVCLRSIPWGEPYVSIDYHIERTEEPNIIQVERAGALLVGCIDCAPSRSDIVSALKAAGH